MGGPEDKWWCLSRCHWFLFQTLLFYYLRVGDNHRDTVLTITMFYGYYKVLLVALATMRTERLLFIFQDSPARWLIPTVIASYRLHTYIFMCAVVVSVCNGAACRMLSSAEDAIIKLQLLTHTSNLCAQHSSALVESAKETVVKLSPLSSAMTTMMSLASSSWACCCSWL